MTFFDRNRICIHADDLGGSGNINHTIKKGISEGLIQKVSIIMNGAALNEAIEIVNEYGIESALHLNFSEGSPISDSDEVPLLIDSNGKFCHSYISFWLKMIFNREFIKQVHKEIEAQIQLYKEKIPGKLIKLDSHQHYHMIPPLFKLLMDMNKDSNQISYIRTTREPFFILSGQIGLTLRNVFSPNIVKWVLLRLLNTVNKRKLRDSSIDSSDLFCGVLYSGCMRAQHYSLMKKKIVRHKENALRAEILFHPGQALQTEETIWEGQAQFSQFYLSDDRSRELKELLSIIR